MHIAQQVGSGAAGATLFSLALLLLEVVLVDEFDTISVAASGGGSCGLTGCVIATDASASLIIGCW